MLRLILLAILILLVVRAFWRVFEGIVEGATGRPPGSSRPLQGVHMERDPVCGTFVVPNRAVSLTDGRRRVYFCSPHCRDAYRAKIA
jgi:hypothetical protein